MNRDDSDHVTQQQLDSLALGSMDSQMADSVLLHIANCAQCMNQYKAIVEGKKVVRGREDLPRTRRLSCEYGIEPENVPKDAKAFFHECQSLLKTKGYEQIKYLGRGGQALVLLAIQSESNYRVAIKCIGVSRLDVTENGQTKLTRFQRELGITRAINHVKVVRSREMLDLSSEIIAIVSDFFPGVSLRSMYSNFHMNWRTALAVIVQVSDAMIAYSALGIIHRDLTFNNILIDRDNENCNIRVIDFGIAKAPESIVTIVKTEGGMGTPGVMPPEQQIRANDVDITVDIYSMGRSLVWCLLPVNARHDFKIKLDKIPQEIPPMLKSLLQKMTHPQVNKRIANPEFLIDEVFQIRKKISKKKKSGLSKFLNWWASNAK